MFQDENISFKLVLKLYQVIEYLSIENVLNYGVYRI